MKTLQKITILIVFVLSISTTFAQKAQKDTTVCYRVAMDCMACKQKIEKNIAFEKGVKALDVNLANKTVKIKFNKQKNTAEQLKKAIEELKYEVEIIDPIEK